MILTCPACDTKYVVKDDAIPPGGRQVRCAACKHSWHQEPEGAVVEAESAAIDFGGPAPPFADAVDESLAETPQVAADEGLIAGEPQPEMGQAEPTWGAAEPGPAEPETATGQVAMEEAPEVANEWRRPEAVEARLPPAEEEFASYAPIIDDDEQPRRRWPLILAILALIFAAAAAFWFFAPPEWKQRAGIAQAGATPLQLMITTSDRQPLRSGNDLLTISGRVINPTDQEQNVPPIQAELRDKQSQSVIHRWTIEPPARVLAPRSSATFYSAGVNVPEGGDELTVTLGG